MFFDRPLLALGNILFIFGLYLIIGPNKAYSFFTRPTKIRGTIFFVIGILLILLKWSIIGFIIEIVGILGLFGDFFGIIVGFLKSVPYLGPILTNRFIEPVSNIFLLLFILIFITNYKISSTLIN